MFSTFKTNKLLALIIFILGVLLSILIPGGPIETRSFSHIDTNVLAIFNIFLTFLGMGSFVIAFFIYKYSSFALYLGKIFSIFYIIVYLLDIFKIFPTSPDNMPFTLLAIEVISTALAVIFLVFSILKDTKNFTTNSSKYTLNYKLVTFAIFLAIAIIIFATYSAMK